MRKAKFPSILLLLFLSIGIGIGQETEDLTLPGDKDPVVVTTGGENPGSPVGASKGPETLIEYVLAGGWAMIPLFLMLFAVIALSVYLFLDLRKKGFLPKQLTETLHQYAELGDLNGISENARASGSCLGQVVNGASDYIFDRGYQVLDGDSIYDQMADASQEFNRKRVTLLNYLSVISQAAPMVGLLGTVSGMIKAFATLNQKGMGDPGQLAGNISEALITTASGLIVALPAIFLFFFFRDKLMGLVAQVDKECAKVLASLRRAVLGKHQTPQPQPEAAPPGHDPLPPGQHPLS